MLCFNKTAQCFPSENEASQSVEQKGGNRTKPGEFSPEGHPRGLKGPFVNPRNSLGRQGYQKPTGGLNISWPAPPSPSLKATPGHQIKNHQHPFLLHETPHCTPPSPPGHFLSSLETFTSSHSSRAAPPRPSWGSSGQLLAPPAPTLGRGPRRPLPQQVQAQWAPVAGQPQVRGADA